MVKRGRDDSGGGGLAGEGAELLTRNNQFPKRRKIDRGGGGGGRGPDRPGPSQPAPPPNRPPQRDWGRMDSTGDRGRDHDKLRDRWNDYVDANPDGWGKKRRLPCVSAVWDRQSGRVYYDHNVKKPLDPNTLDPILRDRYDRSQTDPNWWNYEDDQRRHGTPGNHSETRAVNEAIKAARAEGREPRLEDFMLHNGNPDDKRPMRCCGNCTQMVDGVAGSKAGWEAGGPGGWRRQRGWGGSFGL